MKETEQKTGGMPLWVMIVLVTAMVGAVIMIFQFLKMALPAAVKPGVDITLQLSQNRVISGRMTLMKQDELPDGVAQTWAAGCESGSGYHWLADVPMAAPEGGLPDGEPAGGGNCGRG